MKYSQLAHVPGDAKYWLEQQVEAHRQVNESVYLNHIISLLEADGLDIPPSDSPVLINQSKSYIDFLIGELCTKLRETRTKNSSIHISLDYKSDTSSMDSNLGVSYKFNNGMNHLEPPQPCMPPNSIGARGLLHDSETTKEKMDDYFSSLFYENTADVFGFEYIWNKSDERRIGTDAERVNFYNKQNILSSRRSERLYERNAEINKLIAKFDGNIKEIWKNSSETDNGKYQKLLSHNLLFNPGLQYGSNLIWSFGKNENGGKKHEVINNGNDSASDYKSSFSYWNKVSSPVLSSSYGAFDTMLQAFNATLSTVQKWSAIDGQNDAFRSVVPSHKKTCKMVNGSFIANDDLEYEIIEVGQSSQEEEDLLTSAKTHFRPIRTEDIGSSQAGIYADGTTFAISNDLEKISFRRSESGMLYMEADAGTPRKYMEFKEKDGGSKGDCESDASSMEEFIPKFRVRQSNEKCIQTDDIFDDRILSTVNDTDYESASCDSEDDEFYFPGDEELAQNIINSIEETQYEKVNQSFSDYECNNSMDTGDSWNKLAGKDACVCGGAKDWNRNCIDDSRKHEWNKIWNSEVKCDSCRANSNKLSTTDRYRFREELSQEGEQLLLDLSYLQQMYSNLECCDNDTSIPTSDINDDEIQNSEEVGKVAVIDYPGKGEWWSLLVAKEEPVKNGFDLRCVWKEDTIFSNFSNYEENKLTEKIELPSKADASHQMDRKRRNSSSQKNCGLYRESLCRRPHCKIPNFDSTIPYLFIADSSCLKGNSHHLNGLRRPISL